jgi:hypothetical protein
MIKCSTPVAGANEHAWLLRTGRALGARAEPRIKSADVHDETEAQRLFLGVALKSAPMRSNVMSGSEPNLWRVPACYQIAARLSVPSRPRSPARSIPGTIGSKYEMTKRTFAILLASSLLTGCMSTLPMEPTRESAAAPRRPLTEAEKQAISEAVSLKTEVQGNDAFIWTPLVVRTRDRATDFCGIVRNPSGFAGKPSYSKYLARINFDRAGKLSNVDVVSIINIKDDNIPTSVDSICIQDGYLLSPPSPPKSS